MLLTLSFGTNGISQTEGPNCTNVNAAVEADGYATVVAGDFIINADDATAFDITVENQTGVLPSNTQLVNTTNGVTYITIGAIQLDASVKQATIRASSDQARGQDEN